LSYRGPFGGGILGFPPAISNIVLFTALIYLLQQMFLGQAPSPLALVPQQVLTKGMVWELATYMFLHGGTLHIVFNMFVLVMFGTNLEQWWGSWDFTKYYFITGIGAGVIQVITTYAFGGETWIPVIGASGAIFGVLIAYGMAFPDRKVFLWFVIPVSARTMVAIVAFLELAMVSQGDGVARFAHLGGMLVGYVYLKQENLFWRVKRWWRRVQATVEASRQKRPKTGDPETQARIDEILEKISREGMGALTEEEKKLLHDAGSRARRRQQGHDN
jgi:membrane associated rhomboid family serine protease